jgi:hypothetical protein
VKLRLRWLGPLTALLCEFLGLAALCLTPDVEKPLFVAPLAIGMLAWGLRFRLNDRLVLALVALLVLGGYAASGGAPTGTLMARAIIPAHALLWLARDEALYRFWRIGVGLLELVLAAILAPEVHMFVLLFFFVLVGSLALSLAFIERTFRARDEEALDRPIRPSFVGTVLALSCFIFLSSLLIFPLLPRSRWNAMPPDTSAGYTDVVSFQQSILRWDQHDSRPLLWIFRPDSRAWESIVPYFLLRGQALDHFNGLEWRAGVPRNGTGFVGGQAEGSIEILRQPMNSDVLPVPYGAQSVRSDSEFPIAHRDDGKWIAQGSQTHSVRYEADYGKFRANALGESPVPADLAFDAKIFAETARLARSLAAGAASDDEKLARVEKFFREGGFSFELGAVAAAKPGERHPLERFLFETKKGHCELFASAAALLLRAMGVPARLTVGFRLRAPNSGDVLTVRSSDAHAWVEAWRKTRGWSPIDPTPTASEPNWIGDTASEIYDRVGAYWHRYILEYEFDAEHLVAVAFKALPWAAGSAVILIAWWARRRRRRRSRKAPRELLTRIRDRFEDNLVHLVGQYPEQALRANPEVREWNRLYVNLRFGRTEPTAAEVSQLRQHGNQIITWLRAPEGARGSKSAG